MAGWSFELVGDSSDLELLATLFETGAIYVTRGDDKFLLHSAEVDAFIKPREAQKAAESALDRLKGIASFRGARVRVSLGSAWHVDESGRQNTVVFLKGVEAIASAGNLTPLIDGKPVPPKEDPMLTVALRDRRVAKVLELYGSRQLDYRDLYNVLERVEKDLGATVSEKGWISANARDVFRRTANSESAIGNLARHGTDKNPPPKRPMPLPEARQLIAGIVERWIREKAV